jgi:hypothetical protein
MRAISSRERPSFDEVFDRIRRAGEISVTSSRGTPYRVTAIVSRDGVKTLVARPRSSQVRIHEDCWGLDITCQRTRAGGVYNGSPSIYDWFAQTSGRTARVPT